MRSIDHHRIKFFCWVYQTNLAKRIDMFKTSIHVWDVHTAKKCLTQNRVPIPSAGSSWFSHLGPIFKIGFHSTQSSQLSAPLSYRCCNLSCVDVNQSYLPWLSNQLSPWSQLWPRHEINTAWDLWKLTGGKSIPKCRECREGNINI